MYTFLLIFSLVILLVVGSATAMSYFDRPRKPVDKNDDHKEP